MKRNDVPWTSGYYRAGELEPRHYGLVLLAVAASFLIHYALFESVGDLRFSVSAPAAPRRDTRDYPAIRVDRLARDPALPPGGPAAATGRGDAETSVGELVEELSRRPELALTVPPVPEAIAAGRQLSLLPAPDVALDAGWQPRQEVAAVVRRVVRDEIAAMPRRPLPPVETTEAAPDYILPSDFTKNRLGADILPFRPAAPEPPPPEAIAPAPVAPEEGEPGGPIAPEDQSPAETIGRFAETPGDISGFKPIDDRLMAGMVAYRAADGSGRVYFRLRVAARDCGVLPPVPKDVVFVQDASRSLAEQRLHFCRQALRDAIRTIPPCDRFNVVLFRDKPSFCFRGWASPGPAEIARADAFIDSMRSCGDTDLFDSIKSLLALPRDSRRPLIVILVTDGKATKGLTVPSDIIGQFSKLNDNASVFAIGTHPGANHYLLDLLTYCNRGSSRIAKDRWSIAETIAAAVGDCASPVLARIGVATDVSSHAEVYPLPSANLYAGRVLEYYGACPGDAGEIIFHVRGEGGEAKCDVILRMNLADAGEGGPQVKTEWAKRKMHALVGKYARDPDEAILGEMRRLSAETGVPIPYRRSLGR